jgi:hypothetical protein
MKRWSRSGISLVCVRIKGQSVFFCVPLLELLLLNVIVVAFLIILIIFFLPLLYVVSSFFNIA